MIDSSRIPVFFLNKIFRQDKESAIVLNAHKVRQGNFQVGEQPDVIDQSSDFYFIEEHDPDRVAQRIVQLCSRELPHKFNFDPILDIQVLTPMHKGAVGTINLNHLLQKTLNRQPVLIEAMGNAYKAGDKVMHLINNYQKEVYNGDIGVVLAVLTSKKMSLQSIIMAGPSAMTPANWIRLPSLMRFRCINPRDPNTRRSLYRW